MIRWALYLLAGVAIVLAATIAAGLLLGWHHWKGATNAC